ncbi:MAG: hypothetical protein WCR30_02520 [Clostridia bacterium]
MKKINTKQIFKDYEDRHNKILKFMESGYKESEYIKAVSDMTKLVEEMYLATCCNFSPEEKKSICYKALDYFNDIKKIHIKVANKYGLELASRLSKMIGEDYDAILFQEQADKIVSYEIKKITSKPFTVKDYEE